MKVPPKIHIFLSKLESAILPTLEFLANRALNLGNCQCRWCGYGIDSIQHIFWESQEAKVIWEEVTKWWSLSSTQKCKVGGNLWDSINIKHGA